MCAPMVRTYLRAIFHSRRAARPCERSPLPLWSLIEQAILRRHAQAYRVCRCRSGAHKPGTGLLARGWPADNHSGAKRSPEMRGAIGGVRCRRSNSRTSRHRYVPLRWVRHKAILRRDPQQDRIRHLTCGDAHEGSRRRAPNCESRVQYSSNTFVATGRVALASPQ